MSKYYTMPCGCKFEILEEYKDGRPPKLKFDYYKDFQDCKSMWSLLHEGKTLGIFQLESGLGKHFCKVLRPENLLHIEALGAILRPGALNCISGDTLISTYTYSRGNKNISLEKLYEKFKRKHLNYKNVIKSLDEEKYIIFNNKITNIYYNGKQEVYQPKIKIRKYHKFTNSYYKLHCTLNHKLLTSNGWKELKDIKIGERIAIQAKKPINKKRNKNFKYNKGQKSFRDICFYNYIYKCVLCDWKEGTLDVNHINQNRFHDNSPENLCYFCPNHHRMYSENKINKEFLIKEREKYKLPLTKDIYWAEFLGYNYIGMKDVYDISVETNHNNFIAGNFIVHNCKDSNNISTTQHYCDKKNGKEEAVSSIPALTDLLKDSYGEMIFQEDIMRISMEIAGFDGGMADDLRKGIGSKDAKKLFALENNFLEGCKKVGKVTEEEAKTIFGWIKSAARYSFNKCITYDTIVETEGEIYKTITEINIGDKVKGPNLEKGQDEYIEVTNIYHQGEQEVYEVITETGKVIKCTLNHKFLCEDGVIRELIDIIGENHKIICEEE